MTLTPRPTQRLPQRWQGQSAVLPDECDMHLGRERPRFQDAEPRQEGGRGGRSRPAVPSLLPTAAPTVTRAAQSAARCHRTEPADCEGHCRIRRAQRLSGFRRPRARQQRAGRGNTAPVSVFPLFSRRSGRNWAQPGVRPRVCEGPRSLGPHLLTGLAESDRERCPIWSDSAL
jgi:hypothetical protein